MPMVTVASCPIATDPAEMDTGGTNHWKATLPCRVPHCGDTLAVGCTTGYCPKQVHNQLRAMLGNSLMSRLPLNIVVSVVPRPTAAHPKLRPSDCVRFKIH
jgi:hypothetical protein